VTDVNAPPAQTSLFDEPPEPEAEAADEEEVDEEADEEEAAAGRAKRVRRRSTFALGRTDCGTTELRVIEDADSPISGPFRVKAVVRDGDARGSRESSDG